MLRRTHRASQGGGRLALALGLLVTVGCAGSTTVRATVTHPAEIPLTAYPVVYVALGQSPEGIELGRRVQAELSNTPGLADAGQTAQVHLATAEELQRLRQQRAMPGASVVLRLDVTTRRGVRPSTMSRPETVCDAFRCYTIQRTYMVDVPTIDMSAMLVIEDGPTGRALQQRSVMASHQGATMRVLTSRAIEDVGGQLTALLTARVEQVRTRLLHVDDPGVTTAIEAIRRGEWREGRVLLERAVRSERVHALPDEERADALYNLHIARRFDPTTTGDIERHYRAAEAPLRAALELVPGDRRYLQALEALTADAQRARTLAAQREAAEHNFGMEGGAPAQSNPIPEPPPAYRDASPGGASR